MSATATLHVLRCRSGLNKLALPALQSCRRGLQQFRTERTCHATRSSRRFFRSCARMTAFTTVERGAPNSTDYRLFFRESILSSLHPMRNHLLTLSHLCSCCCTQVPARLPEADTAASTCHPHVSSVAAGCDLRDNASAFFFSRASLLKAREVQKVKEAEASSSGRFSFFALARHTYTSCTIDAIPRLPISLNFFYLLPRHGPLSTHL